MPKDSAKTIQKLSNIIQAFLEVKRAVQILASGGNNKIFDAVGFWFKKLMGTKLSIAVEC